MDRREDTLIALLAELVASRDRRLRREQTIAPAGLERFGNCLATEFPLEIALREAAGLRDRSLREIAKVLPRSVEVELGKAVWAQQAVAKISSPSAERNGAEQSGRRRWIHLPQWIELAAAAVLLTAGVGYFWQKGPSSSHPAGGRGAVVERFSGEPASAGLTTHREASTPSSDNFFWSPGDRLDLAGSKIALAGLRPSLLPLNFSQLDGQSDVGAGIRLDLPVRQILLSAEPIWGP